MSLAGSTFKLPLLFGSFRSISHGSIETCQGRASPNPSPHHLRFDCIPFLARQSVVRLGHQKHIRIICESVIICHTSRISFPMWDDLFQRNSLASATWTNQLTRLSLTQRLNIRMLFLEQKVLIQIDTRAGLLNAFEIF